MFFATPLTLFASSGGSAAHTHISVHSTRPPLPNAPPTTDGLTSHESSFLSSLLAHLPALTALTLPLPASYKRMLDGIWSGGTYVYWGTDNREAPVRLCNASSPSSRNFEVRCHDGLANVSVSLLYNKMRYICIISLIFRSLVCWVREVWALKKDISCA